MQTRCRSLCYSDSPEPSTNLCSKHTKRCLVTRVNLILPKIGKYFIKFQKIISSLFFDIKMLIELFGKLDESKVCISKGRAHFARFECD